MKFIAPVAFVACVALLSVNPAEARQNKRHQQANQPPAAEHMLFDRASGASVAAVAQPVRQSARPSRAERRQAVRAKTRTQSVRVQPAAPRQATRAAAPSQKRARAARVDGSPAMHAKVRNYAEQYGVPADLAHGVVMVESRYNPRATGPGGYIGLMQLSYRTAQGMGYRGSRSALYDPDTNLKYGMKYLAGAYQKSGGSMCGAVSKYQGGHGVKGVTRAGAAYCGKVRQHIARLNSTKGIQLAAN
jgi:soluble lytic murein transglycosylase-like protein